MVSFAVNVIGVPGQTEADGSAVTEIVGVTEAFTVIVTEFEVAVEGFAQGALDVIVHSTTSELFNDEFVYVELFVPTLAPFRVH